MRVKGKDFFRGNFPFLDPVEEIDNLEVILSKQFLHERQAFLGVDRVQRLPSILGFGNDDFVAGREADQVPDQVPG